MLRIKDGFAGQRAVIIPPAYLSELERNPLSALLHITDIGYYPHASHHYRRRDIPISQYVFIYAVNGRGWYELDGRRYEVSPDSYFILPPGIPHAYAADDADPWTIYWIHFKGTLAAEYVTTQPAPVSVRPGLKSRIESRLSLFEEIMNTLDSGYSRENLLYACSVFHHFLGSLRFMRQYHEAGEGHTPSCDDIIALGVRFMNENIGKQLRLADIAAHLGYSPSHLSAVFTRATGMAPIAYFLQLKIKRACALLDFTTLRVNQICHMIGIDDPYYFSRIFTRVMGQSPRAYRAVKKG